MRGPWDFLNGPCIIHSFIVLTSPLLSFEFAALSELNPGIYVHGTSLLLVSEFLTIYRKHIQCHAYFYSHFKAQFLQLFYTLSAFPPAIAFFLFFICATPNCSATAQIKRYILLGVFPNRVISSVPLCWKASAIPS